MRYQLIANRKRKLTNTQKNYANYDKVWEPIPVITVNERQNITFNCKEKSRLITADKTLPLI